MNRSQLNFAIGSTAAAMALTAFAAGSSRADGGVWDPITATFTEQPGDAGSLTSDADVLTGYPVQHIDGTLSGLADLYEINIGDFASFSASVDNLDTTVNNPQLFLFNSAGDAVAMATANGLGGATLTGLGIDSLEGLGHHLSAGDYYIGIAAYNYQPMSGNTDLFGSGAPGTTILSSQPTDELTSWALENGSNAGGTYKIDLTGVIAPEPGVFVTGFAMFGATGLGLVKGRRRASGEPQIARA